MLSGNLGQVDFLAWQVRFLSHLPNKQYPKQVVCQLSGKTKFRLVQGKENLRVVCVKGKMDFNSFLSPEIRCSNF